ncbi:MAG: DMT family transporter [Microscillaceae bacterium]|jgi:drug/metabolite transporter (DMT)-like permease|nr:DMT family transporter [Microscillaceae bacterium]
MNQTLEPQTAKQASKTLTISWLLLIFLALIWGSSFILVKKGLLAFSPMQVASIRTTAGFLALLGLAIPHLRQIPRDKWVYLWLSGMLGVFLPAFLFAYAQTSLSSSLAGVFNALTPLFTLVAGVLFFQQKSSKYKLLGVILGLLGSVGLSFLSSKQGMGQFNASVLLIVLATMMYGVNVNLVKKHLQGLKPLQVSAMSLVAIAPFALLGFWFTDVIGTLGQDSAAWVSLGYLVMLGVFSTAIATVFFNYLLQIATPVFASSVTYLIPIVAIMWGVLDGEQLLAAHFICFLGILGGIGLVNFSK